MRIAPVLTALLLVACGKPAKPEESPVRNAVPKALPVASGQDGFAPLQSAAVQAAIHRALRTGENQRWQDGPWSGYAVPSLTMLANGCRTIRYTIDQQPDAPATTINACDGNR